MQNTIGTSRSFHGASGSTDVIDGTTLAANNPINYVITSNGTQSEFFENRSSQGTNIPSGPVAGVKTVIQIGNRLNGAYLYGHIKNFRIYDVALTPAQVAAL